MTQNQELYFRAKSTVARLGDMVFELKKLRRRTRKSMLSTRAMFERLIGRATVLNWPEQRNTEVTP